MDINCKLDAIRSEYQEKRRELRLKYYADVRLLRIEEHKALARERKRRIDERKRLKIEEERERLAELAEKKRAELSALTES